MRASGVPCAEACEDWTIAYCVAGLVPLDIVLCLTTCPDRERAFAVARALLDEHLATCVSVLPGVTSFYRWQGQMEQADELQLFIKTSRSRISALKTRLPELHSYEVPELIVLDVADGLPAYLAWLDAGVRDTDATGTGT